MGKCGVNMILMGKLIWEHMGNCGTNGDFDGTSYEETLETIWRMRAECGQETRNPGESIWEKYDPSMEMIPICSQQSWKNCD